MPASTPGAAVLSVRLWVPRTRPPYATCAYSWISTRQEIGGGWSAFSKPVGGDFNNDGIGDIAAIKNGSTLNIWNGQGGNEFGPATAIGPGWTPYF